MQEFQTFYSNPTEPASHEVLLQRFPTPLNWMTTYCHDAAVRHHWWHNADGTCKHMNMGEHLVLIHSEISEAMEAARTDAPSAKIEGFSGMEEELADALIRIFDLAGALKMNLGAAFVAKLQYNASRHDHNVEEREKTGGKQF